jgi:hypothetical protein
MACAGSAMMMDGCYPGAVENRKDAQSKKYSTRFQNMRTRMKDNVSCLAAKYARKRMKDC